MAQQQTDRKRLFSYTKTKGDISYTLTISVDGKKKRLDEIPMESGVIGEFIEFIRGLDLSLEAEMMKALLDQDGKAGQKEG
jgi:hypothetical protein